MPTDKQDPQKNWHPWFRAAYEHGQRNNSFCAVRYGSSEHEAWYEYFDRLGWVPSTFRELAPERDWTAPARWPSFLPEITWEAEPSRPATIVRRWTKPNPAQIATQFRRLGLQDLLIQKPEAAE